MFPKAKGKLAVNFINTEIIKKNLDGVLSTINKDGYSIGIQKWIYQHRKLYIERKLNKKLLCIYCIMSFLEIVSFMI